MRQAQQQAAQAKAMAKQMAEAKACQSANTNPCAGLGCGFSQPAAGGCPVKAAQDELAAAKQNVAAASAKAGVPVPAEAASAPAVPAAPAAPAASGKEAIKQAAAEKVAAKAQEKAATKAAAVPK